MWESLCKSTWLQQICSNNYALTQNRNVHLSMQVNIIRIYQQLANFQQYQQRLSALVGKDQAKKIVNQGLVLITLGGNDFVNNYFLVPFSARSRQFALPAYVPFLISEYQKILQVKNVDLTSFSFLLGFKPSSPYCPSLRWYFKFFGHVTLRCPFYDSICFIL